MNELIIDKAVYRTAPATPGLLKSYYQVCSKFVGAFLVLVLLFAQGEGFNVSRMRDFSHTFNW